MKKTKLLCNVFLFLLGTQFMFAQNQNADIDLMSSYEDYTEMDRELVYAHINKSIYIKGETIGVKAYLLDKYTKAIANEAANLYFSISNVDGKTIESKLIMVNNGIAVGDFDIDDSYTSGYYTIKLYTNWMRNFNEENLFVERIRIIDPAVDKQMVFDIDLKKVDAQFLPEGGHLLSGVENTIGVVVKNEKGLGFSYVEGEIIDQNGVVVTNFKVNQFGIGKCLLTPQKGNTYKAKFRANDIEHSVDVLGAKLEGIAMNLTKLKTKVALTLKTNVATLKNSHSDLYKLAIHNGKDLKEMTFNFNEKTEVVKLIANEDLYRGINIFTIFDSNNNPLLERLYFNFEGVDIQSAGEEIIVVNNDSISITLSYELKYKNAQNSFSVSVLPSGTNSNHHHNIISYTLLQPYLRGYIEQAQYYFTNTTPKKQFELDNLLITQGWSSYDWNTVFNTPPEYDFDYENGISFTINSSEKGDKQLMIYPGLNHSTKLVSLTKENASYTASSLFPVENESIKIQEINALNQEVKPNLYIQFDPIKIPEMETNINPLFSSSLGSKFVDFDSKTVNALREIEKLDEVIINKKKDFTEIEKLQNRSLGNVEVIDEVLVKRYRTLLRYLRDKGFTVNETPTKFELYTTSVNSHRDRNAVDPASNYLNIEIDPDGQSSDLRFAPEVDQHVEYVRDAANFPIVYLDGIVLQQDLELLRNLRMDQIEYVEVNKSGAGGGMRSGGGGLIRIKTKPFSDVRVNSKISYGSYEIPLKFSVAKKFYIPQYKSYENDFFNTFGVIDWLPSMTLNLENNLEFKIANNGLNSFKLFVEGITSEGVFISEVKELKIDQL